MPNYAIPVQLFEKVFYKVQELKKKLNLGMKTTFY